MRIEDALKDHHWPALFETFGEEVTYSRGLSVLADPLQVIKGSRATELTSFDFSMTLLADDFLVKYADLISFGIGLPQQSDIIEWTDYQSIARKFEVNIPGAERYYDHMDQMQILIRIHTKEINV